MTLFFLITGILLIVVYGIVWNWYHKIEEQEDEKELEESSRED